MLRWFHVPSSGFNCPSYLAGLYSANEVNDFIMLDGYIPVSTVDELNSIGNEILETMGVGSCWEGEYLTNKNSKYIQVFNFSMSSFGSWAEEKFTDHGFVYDGNELGITGYTGEASLFNTGSCHVRNMRVFGTLTDVDFSRVCGGIIGRWSGSTSSGDGSFTNNHFTGNITKSIFAANAQIGGLIGYISGGNFNNIDISDNYFNGEVYGNGNHVGGVIGRGYDNIANISVSNNTVVSTRIEGSQIVGGFCGSAKNMTVVHVNNVSNILGSGIGGVCGWENGSNDFYGCENNVDIYGVSYVGGIVGRCTSTGSIIQYCKNTGNISGGSYCAGIIGDGGGVITKCLNTGTINGTVGCSGIVGVNNGAVISECFNNADCTGTQKVGGIVGRFNSGSILDCYSIGEMTASTFQVGGLVGATQSGSISITNSWTTGEIGAGGGTKGGLVGGVFGGTPTVSNCYWDQTIGFATSPLGTGKTTSELQTPTTNSGIYSAWTIPPWNFGTDTEYPTLSTTP